MLWYLIRDQPGSDYATSYFSGIYFFNGTKKPSYTAYSFPLVVSAVATKAQIWGIAPQSGKVAVQERIGGRWKTIHTFHSRAGAVFTALVAPPTSNKAAYRAVDGATASLTWTY